MKWMIVASVVSVMGGQGVVLVRDVNLERHGQPLL